MSQPRPIELLSPAHDAGCGMAAIDCGADAVYIGAPDFGARAAAGNSIDDIDRLVSYAHRYGARVYATLNTILYDSELEPARQLALQLHSVGVDALITQDLALLTMGLPIPLNASTQMDISTPEKALWLSRLGYNRLILARELTLRQIKDIGDTLKKHRYLFKKGRNLFQQHADKFSSSPNAFPSLPNDESILSEYDVPTLEVFVHGALCVSYSGRCYASQYCFDRSANRGRCAQFCRLAFNLEDAAGKVLQREKYLLSTKDLNRSQSLEDLIDSGVSSFKIEGRLKGIDYVSNVTAFYRQAIDRILERRTDLRRASYGQSVLTFKPDLRKSFNRGFTDYFLHGRTASVVNVHTPKSVGEPVGRVKSVFRREVVVSGTTVFHNGDGFCFFDVQDRLQGFRVNRVENNRLFLAAPCPELREGMALYRNFDAEFSNHLQHSRQRRTMWLDLTLKDDADGLILLAADESGLTAHAHFAGPFDTARTPQRERIRTELSKLGGTAYRIRNVSLDLSNDYFIPASHLAQWRRRIVDSLAEMRAAVMARDVKARVEVQSAQRAAQLEHVPDAFLEGRHLDYTWNVANAAARDFCLKQGAASVDEAFELSPPDEPLLMTCRHCLKYTFGMCPKYGARAVRTEEPLYLSLPDGRRFRLSFDCKNCQMKVYASR